VVSTNDGAAQLDRLVARFQAVASPRPRTSGWVSSTPTCSRPAFTRSSAWSRPPCGGALNDYLWGGCAIESAAYDVTPAVLRPAGGAVLLVPPTSWPARAWPSFRPETPAVAVA
jgi:hypothetical protein